VLFRSDRFPEILSSINVTPDGDQLICTGGGTFGRSAWVGAFNAANGDELWRVTIPEQQGAVAVVHSPGVFFSPDGSTAYLTTRYGGSTVGVPNLWAVDLSNAAAPCPADLDADGVVASADLAIFLGNWGVAGQADVNGDGSVGSEDLSILLGSWGPCTTP